MTELKIDVFRVYGEYIPEEKATFSSPGAQSEFYIDRVYVEDSDLDLSHVASLTTWLTKKAIERIENARNDD